MYTLLGCFSTKELSLPEACNFIKIETLVAQVFSCEFCEISKNTFSYRTPPMGSSGIKQNQIRRKISLQITFLSDT